MPYITAGGFEAAAAAADSPVLLRLDRNLNLDCMASAAFSTSGSFRSISISSSSGTAASEFGGCCKSSLI